MVDRYFGELEELRKNIADYVHALAGSLTVLVGNMEMATLDIQNGEISKEKLLHYMYEMQNQCEELENVMRKLSGLAKK